MRFSVLILPALLAFSAPVMALELRALWDFDRPELSESRFRQALQDAKGDEALILQTQIARSYGLRRDFIHARAHLQSLEPALQSAGPEARAWASLELGRSYASATHGAEQLGPQQQALARQSFEKAIAIASEAHLDALAIDALHMLAFVDTAPKDQLKWAQQALAIAQASQQADAKRWEASLRNNIGYALHQLGRLDEALDQFEQALILREQAGIAKPIRIALWMKAWTLRAMGRSDEALAIQLRLEKECSAALDCDPDVYEELEVLYRERGNLALAGHYAGLRNSLAIH